MGRGVASWDSAYIVAPRVCLAKVPFLAQHERRKGCGHICTWKIPQMILDSKYRVCKSNTLGPSVISKVPFLPYTMREKGVAWWDPAHVTPRVKLYMHTKF